MQAKKLLIFEYPYLYSKWVSKSHNNSNIIFFVAVQITNLGASLLDKNFNNSVTFLTKFVLPNIKQYMFLVFSTWCVHFLNCFEEKSLNDWTKYFFLIKSQTLYLHKVLAQMIDPISVNKAVSLSTDRCIC